MGALADSRLPEEKKTLPEDEEETLQEKNTTQSLGALRPQTPHRSPRQAFGGNRNNQFLKLHHNEKKILARSPLDKIPIAAAVSPPPANTLGDEGIAATRSRDRGDTLRLKIWAT